jgi:Ca2+-binding RTX toxin-like protein
MRGRLGAVILVCLALGTTSSAAQFAAETCFGAAATIVGTERNDQISGTAAPDVIVTLGGDDSVLAAGGDDRICTGVGADAILGGPGNDSIDGGADTDGAFYYDAPGPVQVSLQQGSATGAAGRDTLVGVENATGSAFADSVVGNADMNVLIGDTGNDRIEGGPESDALAGGPGDDVLIGRRGDGDAAAFVDAATGVQADLQSGTATGQGRDTMTDVESLIGSQLGDRLSGDGGLNILVGLDGNDVLDGRDGFDLAAFFGSAVTASLVTHRAQGEGTDTLTNIEGLAGSSGSDRLTGDAKQNFIDGREGNDALSGGAGPDILFGRGGTDRVDGGAGNDKLFGGADSDLLVGGAGAADSVSYIDSVAGVRADLTARSAAGGEGSDRFSGVEGLSGSSFADVLTGDSKGNELFGNDGDDTLSGRAGSDFLAGGAGTDVLQPGAGQDYCLDDAPSRGCELSGAPAIPGAPDAPPVQSTPARSLSSHPSTQLLIWMTRAIQRQLAFRPAPHVPQRRSSRFPTAVKTTAGYEYSAEPVCISAKRGGVTEIAPPNVVRPVGDDDRREEAWWQATLFRQDPKSGRFTKRQTKTAWARAQLAGDVVVPGVVVWKDVSGRRAFRSPIALRVPRGRYVWKGQIYWVRSGGRIFAPVEPHLIRAQTITHNKHCDFR